MKLALLAAALAGAAPPQPVCLTSADAEAMALVALPEIIRQSGDVCAGRLPADSLLRRPAGAFLARYDAEADRAWPAARTALAKLSDSPATVLLQSDYARPLVTSLVVPLIVGRIDPADCGALGRLVTELAPLPPRSTAGLVVTLLGYLSAEKRKGRGVDLPDLPLCPDAGR